VKEKGQPIPMDYIVYRVGPGGWWQYVGCHGGDYEGAKRHVAMLTEQGDQCVIVGEETGSGRSISQIISQLLTPPVVPV
jgi:hypothetical protein